MPPDQYERWVDFASRMALRGFGTLRETNRIKLERLVRDFFDAVFDSPESVADVDSWDQGPDIFVCDEFSIFVDDLMDIALGRPSGRMLDWLETAPDDEIAKVYPSCEGDSYDWWRYRRRDAWGAKVRCCVRAGLDVVAEPSAGVVGFDVGDLRRMYPEGLPGWLAGCFVPPITAATPDEASVRL